MIETIKTYEIRIHGNVQGVWFRASAKEVADQLGLKGWVRNEPDGTVLAHVQGPDEPVKKFIEWCHEGPPAARVEKVETAMTTAPIYENFSTERGAFN